MLPAVGAERCECKMKKRIIAGLLIILTILSLVSCSKIKKPDSVNEDDPDADTPPSSGETRFNFLVLGHDRAANLADVILLISFDTDQGDLTLMQIPRDTFLDYGGSHYKINSMFSSAYNQTDKGSKNRDLDAARAFAKTLEETLCVKIHYATVMDLDGFGAIVDAIGGVDMNVPFDMTYKDKGQGLNINLKKGQQTLNGDQAEQFVRFRSAYVQGDIGRGDAQKLFMTAFIQSLKNNLSIGTVGEIVNAVYEHVDTELSVTDMIYFGKKALGIELSNVTMMTLPGEPKTSAVSGASYYVMNRAAVIDVIDKNYNIYDFAITDDIFDRNQDFCNTTDSEMEKAYLAAKEDCLTSMHNGQDISNNSIDIGLLK